MVVQSKVWAGALPLALDVELQQLRVRYAGALREAAVGNFRRAEELQALCTQLGRILAREARRPLAERGVPMRALSIAVDRYFPELREFTLQ